MGAVAAAGDTALHASSADSINAAPSGRQFMNPFVMRRKSTIGTMYANTISSAARFGRSALRGALFFVHAVTTFQSLPASPYLAMAIIPLIGITGITRIKQLIDRAKSGDMAAALELKSIAEQSPDFFTEDHIREIVAAEGSGGQFPKIGILDLLVERRLELFKDVSLDDLRKIHQSGKDAGDAVAVLHEIRVGQSNDDGHSTLAAVHTSKAEYFADRGIFPMSLSEFEAAVVEGTAAARFAEANGATAAAVVQYRRLAGTYRRLAEIYFQTGLYLKSLDAFFEADQAMDFSAKIQTQKGDFDGLYRSRSTQISGYLARAAEISGRLGNRDALLKVMRRKLEISETDFATLNDNRQTESWRAAVQGRADFSSEIAQFYYAAGSYSLAAEYFERAGHAFTELKKAQNDLGNYKGAYEAWRSGIGHLNEAASAYAFNKQHMESARVYVMVANILENMAYQVHRKSPDGSQGLYQEMSEAYDKAVDVLRQGGFWDVIQSALDAHNVVHAVEGRLLGPLEIFVVYFDLIRSSITGSKKRAENTGDSAGAAKLDKILVAMATHNQWTAQTGMRKSVEETMTSIRPIGMTPTGMTD